MSEAKILDGIEHVRKRPGMYFGGTDSRALNFVINFTLENVVDQVRAGKANQVVFTLVSPQQFQLEDNGTGIPVREHQSTGMSVLETIMTVRGGRHYNEETDTFYGSMFGVGLAGINAFSSEMLVEVKRDGFLWQQTYSRGKATSPFTQVRPLHDQEDTGTKITYTVDKEIFGESPFDDVWIARRLQDIAYLCVGVEVIFADLLADRSTTFVYPNGSVDYLAKLNRSMTPVHDPIVIREKVALGMENSRSILEIDVALQFVEESEAMVVSFVKLYETPDEGIQIEILYEQVVDKFLLDADTHRSDILQGLVVVFFLNYPFINLSAQHRPKLLNENLKEPLESLIGDALDKFKTSKPEQFQKIIEYINRNRERRLARRYP